MTFNQYLEQALCPCDIFPPNDLSTHLTKFPILITEHLARSNYSETIYLTITAQIILIRFLPLTELDNDCLLYTEQ